MLPLLLGWLLDLAFGDPRRLPHPVVLFGRAIALLERKANRGRRRGAKGAAVAVGLVALTYVLSWALLVGAAMAHPLLSSALAALMVFYCLAGTTLISEVRQVFAALNRSLDDGRRQVARIVGRDTGQLSAQEVRTAALETLSENLSDGVVAPLFWYALLGAPGMMAYKMVNTLDSMIGYRTERYRLFGRAAARMDDAANYIPARLTAILMVIATAALTRKPRSIVSHWRFVKRNGPRHASPNSGWPEAALAGALHCRFGGPHEYFGQVFQKPYIGTEERNLTADDLRLAVSINRASEAMMIALSCAFVAVWFG